MSHVLHRGRATSLVRTGGVAQCWGRVVVGVRMPTRTLVLGFCMLGYPARLERPGFVYPIVGVRVAALGFIFELIPLLGFVFELPELVYLVVPGFEPPAFVYPVLVFLLRVSVFWSVHEFLFLVSFVLRFVSLVAFYSFNLSVLVFLVVLVCLVVGFPIRLGLVFAMGVVVGGFWGYWTGLRFQAVVLAVVTVAFVLRVPVLAIAVSHAGRVGIVAGRVV